MHWLFPDAPAGRAGKAFSAIPGLIGEVRRSRGRPDTLVLNLSYENEPTLRHVAFGAPTVDLADTEGDYFLTLVEPVVAAVEAMIGLLGPRRICFFGLSKGGFSALMLSRLVAERNPAVRVGAVALGPLTRLWPRDPRIGFPSYGELIARAAHDAGLGAALAAHGDQSRDASLPNLRWMVAYGVRSKRDSRAALALTGRSLTLIPLPLSSHGVLIPFLCQGQPAERVERIVAAAARNGAVDRDLASEAVSADGALMLAEIRAMLPLPTVPELVRLSVDPRAFPMGEVMR